MKAFKITLILSLAILVLGVCIFEFKKQTDLNPQIELVTNKEWSLSSAQLKEFEKINQAFISQIGLGNFVTEFSNIFKSLSKLSFVEDARWAWDYKRPLKIKAIISKPKALMFKNNDWYLVNDKGLVLKKVSLSETLDLPIFRSDELLRNDFLRENSFAILSAFDSDGSKIPMSAVSEIGKDKKGIYLILSEGYKVYMSDKKTAVQIERLSNVINYLKKENIHPEFIDTRLVQKILVRPLVKKD